MPRASTQTARRDARPPFTMTRGDLKRERIANTAKAKGERSFEEIAPAYRADAVATIVRIAP